MLPSHVLTLLRSHFSCRGSSVAVRGEDPVPRGPFSCNQNSAFKSEHAMLHPTGETDDVKYIFRGSEFGSVDPHGSTVSGPVQISRLQRDSPSRMCCSRGSRYAACLLTVDEKPGPDVGQAKHEGGNDGKRNIRSHISAWLTKTPLSHVTLVARRLPRFRLTRTLGYCGA